MTTTKQQYAHIQISDCENAPIHIIEMEKITSFFDELESRGYDLKYIKLIKTSY